MCCNSRCVDMLTECTMPRGCAINVTWSFQPRMHVSLEPCCLQKKWRRRHTQQLNQELLNSVNTYVDQQYPSYYGDMNSGYGNRAVYSQGHPYQTYPPMPPSHQVVRNSAGCIIYGLTNSQFSGNELTSKQPSYPPMTSYEHSYPPTMAINSSSASMDPTPHYSEIWHHSQGRIQPTKPPSRKRSLEEYTNHQMNWQAPRFAAPGYGGYVPQIQIVPIAGSDSAATTMPSEGVT